MINTTQHDGSGTARRQQPEDKLRSSQNLHLGGTHTDLGHAALVPEQDADAGGRHTLACQLADLLNHLLGGGLAPAGRAALVGEGGGAEPLALAVHAPHV
eukprot:1140087-Pelagomonas_calceolata.AAC.5